MNPNLSELLSQTDRVMYGAGDWRVEPGSYPPPKVHVGVDLGTAYTVLVVLDEHYQPIAGEYQFAQVTRDGLVVDFIGAVDLLRAMKLRVEKKLGFELPRLLTNCYTQIGNGGFGPGYGIIGLNGGFASDLGNLVETYEALKKGQEMEGREWKPELLPFCTFGCNTFSCVACDDSHQGIWLFEDFDIWPQKFSLENYLQGWLGKADLLAHDRLEIRSEEIINPFTGKKATVRIRKPKK
jgi:hypothetical protein